MKNLPVSQYRSLESQISKWTKLGACLVGALILLLGGIAIYDRVCTGQLQGELGRYRAQLKEQRKKLAEAERVRDYPKRTAYDAIRAFQKEFEGAAAYRGCFITIFQVAGEPAPFTTAFGKVKPDPDLAQGSVRFELTGKTLNAIATLRQISTGEVPIEFDSLELRRGKVDPDGATLIASGSLRIVGELAGGKA